MSVARAQILAFSKRLFSGIPISHRRPYCASSPQFTADDKFAFLDAVDGSRLPFEDPHRFHVYIKKSCLNGDASEQEKMDFYVKTAAQVVGSEDEAKERIYKVSRDCSFCAFGIEMGWDVATEFECLDTVDSYGPESTGQDFVNCEVVRWSLMPKRTEKGCFLPLPKPPQLESDEAWKYFNY